MLNKFRTFKDRQKERDKRRKDEGKKKDKKKCVNIDEEFLKKYKPD